MRRWGALCGALLVLVPVIAAPSGAAQLVTRYRVEEAALKLAPAGTLLTFALHADAGCNEEFYSEDVAIEAVDLLQRLSLRRVKGAPRPPKTVEIRHRIAGIEPPASIYLTVTGPGIVPAGGTCQLQTASVGGTWNYLAVNGDATVADSSPTLANVTVAKPSGNPPGIYCVALPSDSHVTSAGAQATRNGSPGFVTIDFGGPCASEGLGVQVSVYNLVGGVPTLANGSFSLSFPTYVSPSSP